MFHKSIRATTVFGILAVAFTSAGCGSVDPGKTTDDKSEMEETTQQESRKGIDEAFLALVDGFGANLAQAGFSESEVAEVKTSIFNNAATSKSAQALALGEAEAGVEFKAQAELLSKLAGKAFSEVKLSAAAKVKVDSYPALLLDSVVDRIAQEGKSLSEEARASLVAELPGSILSDAKAALPKEKVEKAMESLSKRAFESFSAVVKDSEKLGAVLEKYSEKIIQASKDVAGTKADARRDVLLEIATRHMLDHTMKLIAKVGTAYEEKILGAAAEGLMRASVDEKGSEADRERQLGIVMGAMLVGSAKTGGDTAKEERFLKFTMAGATQAILERKEGANLPKPEDILETLSQKAVEHLIKSKGADGNRAGALLAIATQGISETAIKGMKDEARRDAFVKMAEAGALQAISAPQLAGHPQIDSGALRLKVVAGVDAAASAGIVDPVKLEALYRARVELIEKRASEEPTFVKPPESASPGLGVETKIPTSTPAAGDMPASGTGGGMAMDYPYAPASSGTKRFAVNNPETGACREYLMGGVATYFGDAEVSAEVGDQQKMVVCPDFIPQTSTTQTKYRNLICQKDAPGNRRIQLFFYLDPGQKMPADFVCPAGFLKI